MKSKLLLCVATILVIAGAAKAQLANEFKAPSAPCCLPRAASALAAQLQDWNQLARYQAANVELKNQPFDPKRVVFMGDSITDAWRLAEFFPGKPYVNRGISGQTTSQMLVRIYPDVIALKPGGVVILAGTNDIAQNTGPMTAEMIEDNIVAMTELAQSHGIKVLLCSITPISDYPFLAQQSGGGRGATPRQQMSVGRPPADILKLNAWMKAYAARVNAVYVDYYVAMADQNGWLRDGISNDGLHPTAEGYKIMAPIVEAAIEQTVQ